MTTRSIPSGARCEQSFVDTTEEPRDTCVHGPSQLIGRGDLTDCSSAIGLLRPSGQSARGSGERLTHSTVRCQGTMVVSKVSCELAENPDDYGVVREPIAPGRIVGDSSAQDQR